MPAMVCCELSFSCLCSTDFGGRGQVIVSVAEHHSNLVPWQLACQRTGATLRHVPLTPDTQELDMQVSLTFCMHMTRLLLHCLCYAVLATHKQSSFLQTQ